MSERVGRVFGKFRVRPAFRPVRTLAQIFEKPRDRLTINQVQESVYKVSCLDCTFTYVGESKRTWNSCRGEHDPGRASNSESTIKLHAESTDHNIHEMPRSSSVMLTTKTKGIFWNHGTQL